MQLSERAQFLVDNLDWAAATGVDDARPEFFQLSLWSDDSTFRIENKSRQIAWSWALAADFMADAILGKRDGIFVSINLEEAKEKIRYAKAVYENLRVDGLPKLIRDSQLNLELANGARLTSLPSKPARGRARSNVGLDEFAHAQRDRSIYTGSLPVISKGGRLRIGSSPLGASGVFWEVFAQTMRSYPGYRRRSTPWWHVYSFCTNVREAIKLAPAMATAQRVDLFGNDRIKAIYANMPLEDFQQEYEAEFVDETTAWISWEEIRLAQAEDLVCFTAESRESFSQEITDAVDGLAAAVQAGTVEQVFTAGMDIGRTRNTSELFLVGMSTTGQHPLRMMITLDNMRFEDQLAALYYALRRLPIALVLIDQNGIGRNLAETASSAYPARVAGVDFTNATKTLWATDAKMLIQQRRTPLPVDRELAYQIHSIKKLVTASRNLVFDSDRNEKHHADKFWAWALALHGAYQRPPAGDELVVVHDEAVTISPY